VQGIEKDILDRNRVLLVAVLFASTPGLADVEPVGGAVAGAVKPGAEDEGFHQYGLVAISRFPMVGELFGDGSKDS